MTPHDIGLTDKQLGIVHLGGIKLRTGFLPRYRDLVAGYLCALDEIGDADVREATRIAVDRIKGR